MSKGRGSIADSALGKDGINIILLSNTTRSRLFFKAPMQHQPQCLKRMYASIRYALRQLSQYMTKK